MVDVTKIAASSVAPNPFPGLTGLGVRVGVIDSGVHASHPHITGIAGGVTIGTRIEDSSYADQLGHGTAVMAAIQEKAPQATYFAIRVFQTSLRTTAGVLQRAIEWCLSSNIDIINLSLGAVSLAHAELFKSLVAQAANQRTILVSASEAAGIPSFPGSLPGVISTNLDWNCSRETYSCNRLPGGRISFSASGFPRPIPGVLPQRNLHGISFAVANMTGFVARARQSLKQPSYEDLCSALELQATRSASP